MPDQSHRTRILTLFAWGALLLWAVAKKPKRSPAVQSRSQPQITRQDAQFVAPGEAGGRASVIADRAVQSHDEKQLSELKRFNRAFRQVVPAFFLRYRRLLPVIGLAIVFSTFVVHDYYREDAKDLADSLNRAEQIFKIRQEVHSQDQVTSEIAHDVRQLYEKYLPSLHAIKKTSEEMDYLHLFRIVFDQDEATQMSDQRLVGMVKDLNDKLPFDAESSHELEELQTALGERGSLLRDLQSYLYYNTAVEPNKIARLETQLDHQKIQGKFFSLSDGEAVDIPLAVGLFADRIFLRATQESEMAESRSRSLKKLSIFLYTAGFLLTLVGRFLMSKLCL
jgi:hypothetical protein